MTISAVFSLTITGVAPPPPPPGMHTVVIGMAEDPYQGDAQYTIAVDGAAVASGSITTLQSSGNSQDVAISVPDGPHTITVSFVADAYGGSPQLDRNLYVNYVKYDGASVWTATAPLFADGAQLTVSVPPIPLQPTSITLIPVSTNIFDNAPAGTVLATAQVTMSDGSPFAGVLTTSDTSFFTIAGMNIVTARALKSADDGTHNTTITAHQAGQTVAATISM